MAIMRCLLFVLLIGILVSCTNHNYTGRRWVTYTSPDKKFSIDIPQGYEIGAITEKDKILGTYKKQYVYWRFPSSWISDFDIKLIQLCYFDLPHKYKNRMEDTILKKYAEDLIETWSEHGNVTVADIPNSGYRGKYIFFKATDGEPNTAIYWWKCIVNGTVYSFEVFVYNNYDNQREINRAFNSFRILP